MLLQVQLSYLIWYWQCSLTLESGTVNLINILIKLFEYRVHLFIYIIIQNVLFLFMYDLFLHGQT